MRGIFIFRGLKERCRLKRNETAFRGYKVGSLYIWFRGSFFFFFNGNELGKKGDAVIIGIRSTQGVAQTPDLII